MRVPVDLPHAYRLLNHGPVTLVSSAHAGLTAFAATRIGAPLVEGCVAWLECRVFRDGKWRFDHSGVDSDLRTLHYFGGGAFAVTGASVHCE